LTLNQAREDAAREALLSLRGYGGAAVEGVIGGPMSSGQPSRAHETQPSGSSSHTSQNIVPDDPFEDTHMDPIPVHEPEPLSLFLDLHPLQDS